MSFTASLHDIITENRNGLLAQTAGATRVPLGKIAKILNGAPFASSEFVKTGGTPLIRIRDILRGASETGYTGDYDPAYLVNRDEILVGMDGDFHCAAWQSEPSLLNQRVCKITPDPEKLLPKYLLHILPGYLDAINANTPSITVKHLSSRTLGDVPLPLPPLPTQHRIVAEIEEKLSRLDAAQSALLRAQANLKRYRASILAQACTGDFPIHPFGDICQIQGGIQKQPKRAPVANHFPFLRVANVLRGRLKLEDVHQVELFGEELKRLRLANGDLLIVEGNGSPAEIGRMAIWRNEIADCVHQNHIIRARPSAKILPDYAAIYWNSPLGQDAVQKVASSSSGLYTLSVRKLAAIPIPLPSIKDQQKIVEDVELRLSVIDRTEQSLRTQLERAKRLRQSILQQAFSPTRQDA